MKALVWFGPYLPINLADLSFILILWNHSSSFIIKLLTLSYNQTIDIIIVQHTTLPLGWVELLDKNLFALHEANLFTPFSILVWKFWFYCKGEVRWGVSFAWPPAPVIPRMKWIFCCRCLECWRNFFNRIHLMVLPVTSCHLLRCGKLQLVSRWKYHPVPMTIGKQILISLMTLPKKNSVGVLGQFLGQEE